MAWSLLTLIGWTYGLWTLFFLVYIGVFAITAWLNLKAAIAGFKSKFASTAMTDPMRYQNFADWYSWTCIELAWGIGWNLVSLAWSFVTIQASIDACNDIYEDFPIGGFEDVCPSFGDLVVRVIISGVIGMVIYGAIAYGFYYVVRTALRREDPEGRAEGVKFAKYR